MSSFCTCCQYPRQQCRAAVVPRPVQRQNPFALPASAFRPVNLIALRRKVGLPVPASFAAMGPRVGVTYLPPNTARMQVRAPILRVPASFAAHADQTMPVYLNWAPYPAVGPAQVPSGFKAVAGQPGFYVPGRTQSVTCKVYDQGQCGDCWMVSSTSVLSDRWTIVQQQMNNVVQNPQLSPSYGLACLNKSNEVQAFVRGQSSANAACGDLENAQCGGGYPACAGIFFENVGTVPSCCMSYEWCSTDSDCNGTSGNSDDIQVPVCPATCTGVCGKKEPARLFKAVQGTTVTLPDILSMQINIQRYGPIVGMFVVKEDFEAMGTGGFQDTNGIYCRVTPRYSDVARPVYGTASPNTDAGNHAIAIVGWGASTVKFKFAVPLGATPKDPNYKAAGEELPVRYWIIRNSWSSTWGDHGYCRFAMSDSTYGINVGLGLDTIVNVSTGDVDGATNFGGAVAFQASPDATVLPNGQLPIPNSNNNIHGGKNDDIIVVAPRRTQTRICYC